MTEITLPLPGKWFKIFSQRKTGATMGSWDIYMRSPANKRLRSNPELIKHCKEANLAMDPGVVNMATVLPKDHKNFRATKMYKRLLEDLGPLAISFSPEELATIETMDPVLEEALKSLTGTKTRGAGVHRGTPGANGARPRKMCPLSVAQGRVSKKKRSMYAFTQKQLKYLNRQFLKVPNPNYDQLQYLGIQLKVPYADVEHWYQCKRDLQRPMQSFDVIENADVDEGESIQERLLSKDVDAAGGDPIVVETDNADFDIEVVGAGGEGEEFVVEGEGGLVGEVTEEDTGVCMEEDVSTSSQTTVIVGRAGEVSTTEEEKKEEPSSTTGETSEAVAAEVGTAATEMVVNGGEAATPEVAGSA